MKPGTVVIMGDNPVLPRMPQRPRLVDFFKHRITDITYRHLLTSAKRAMEAGQDEKIVLACLLHDISNGCLIRSDHGYWGAQMIAPYVDEEVAWAVQNHQALRYFADESVGYRYSESYIRFFGEGHRTVFPRAQGGTRVRRVECRPYVAYRDMAEQRSLRCA